jgi:hypothetical protein
MARHYATIENGKVIDSTNDFVLKNDRTDGRVSAQGLPDGTYRVAVLPNKGRMPWTNFGTRIKSKAHEAARLEKQDKNRATVARTSMPGVTGYQEGADLASHALYAKRRECHVLIDWLKS